MWQKWQQAWKRPVVWIPMSVAGLFHLGSWIVIFRNIAPNNDFIVLHYTQSFGVNLLGSWYEALYIPLFGLIILLCNFFFGVYWLERNHVLAYFFLIMTPILEFLIFAATIFIVLANLPKVF